MKVSPGVQPPPNTFECNFMQSVTRSLYVEDYKGCRVLSVVYTDEEVSNFENSVQEFVLNLFFHFSPKRLKWWWNNDFRV